MKIVENFPPPTRGRNASYDYSTLFDGKLRQLQQGTDFQVKANTFRNTVWRYAKMHGLSVTIMVRDADVYIQAQRNSKPKKQK